MRVSKPRLLRWGWAGLLCASLVAAEPAPADAGKLQRLIEQLAHPGFKEREAATRELDSLGEAALSALKPAQASPDPETRLRATDLVERIECRLATARLIQPTSIELNYNDIPLGELLEDFSKRSGTSVILANGSPKALASEKVSISTDALPFWEALDELSRKLQLVEVDPFKVEANPHGAQPVPGRRIRVSQPQPAPILPGQIVLQKGTPNALPMGVAGAVRIRCLPLSTATPAGTIGTDELLLPVQVTAEAKLNATGETSLRIDKAIDEFGQTLKISPQPIAAPQQEEGFVIAANGMLMPRSTSRRTSTTALRVTRGSQPAKQLRELSGAATLQIQVTEAMVSIDKPLDAAGTAVRGTYGVTLKLFEAKKAALGGVRLKVELELPSDVQAGGLMPGLPGMGGMGQIQLQGGGIIQQRVIVNGIPRVVASAAPDVGGLQLTDDKGRKFNLQSSDLTQMHQNQNGGTVLQMDLHFRPPRDAGEAHALTFVGTRPGTVEVPFALKNVPLP